MGIRMLKFPRMMRRLRYLHTTELRKFLIFWILISVMSRLNTQREDWLLPTEPLHGARPRQTGRERPPVIENRLPMEATGGAASRKPGRAPLLSPGRQISMEEEVTTPQRGGGGRSAPEPQGAPRGVRVVPNPFPNDFPEDSLQDGDLDRQDIESPVDMLVNMVARMQKDIAILREENRLLRTPEFRRWCRPPGGWRAAFTTTKVPRFDGTTSWEQYRQVFEAIVRSNGWDSDTAALQLFSHLEGDTRNVAHLVPLSRRLSQSGLVDARTAHYGSPGRLVDYRRQFERTTRTVGEDPAIFATALESLAVKAFGDMGQTARLRLIRDRFIAGHSNCDLRRHLDSVPPETPIRDVVDRCRIWESHADPAVRWVGKPSPDPVYPAYAVDDAGNNIETTKVAMVTGQKSSLIQLEDLLRRVLAPAEPPDPEAGGACCGEIATATGESRPPAVVNPPVPTDLKQMLRSFLEGRHQRRGNSIDCFPTTDDM